MFSFDDKKLEKTGVRPKKGRTPIDGVVYQLGHSKCASAYAKADSLDTKVAVVAAPAINIPIRSVVQVCRIERFAAVCTREAPLVPYSVLADHLLGRVDRESAPQTS